MIYLATFGKFRYDPVSGAGTSNYKIFQQVVTLKGYVLTKRKEFDIYPARAHRFGETFEGWKIKGDLFLLSPIFFKYLYKANVEKQGLKLDYFHVEGYDQPVYFFSEDSPTQGQPILMFESVGRDQIRELNYESNKQKDNLPDTVD